MAIMRPFRPALRKPGMLVGLMVVLALGLGACDHGGAADKAPERGDSAAAKVDGKTIWASDVKREAVAQGLIGEGR